MTPLVRILTWMVGTILLAVLITACVSSDDSVSTDSGENAVAAGAEPEGSEVAEEPLSPADDQTGDWASEVATFVNYDLQRQEIMNMSGALLCCVEGPPQVAHWQIRCEWVDEQAQLALDARPTAPAAASEAWAPYAQLVEDYWTGFQSTCEEFLEDPNVVESDPSFGTSIFVTGDARLAACEAVLVDLEPQPADAPIAYCEYPLNEPIPIETFPDLPAQLEEFLTGGGMGGPGPDGEGPDGPPTEPVDAAAGPTSGMGLLEPGIHEFSWYQPVFSVVNDEPWLVEAMPDSIVMLDRVDGPPKGVIEILGPGGIADPEQAVAGEEWTTGPVPTIPVPADLTDWVAAMPLVGEPTPLTIGGVDATYWKLEYDRAAPGNEVIVYAWQEIDGALAVGLDQFLHVWHVPRADGALLIVEQGFLGEDIEPMAPNLFENLSFG
jgi:hypothetical protein